jgi:hypothetical protein
MAAVTFKSDQPTAYGSKQMAGIPQSVYGIFLSFARNNLLLIRFHKNF